ncbi:proline iminopeptidase [Sulfurifustis variabilis]|uniref:Proline iminopeptidase n=1 Tax=Sulfurifustis variabilis TaxID=1675686 RepID=A0A1B4UZM0_9GAMM|nr:prolyl aminopeptidase [Sulfurifustis variabilis]BAU46589.1 proline iminopeptidase [Sulfurifustis variabilis]
MTVYPDIQPYATHRLAVDPPHELYVEECGNSRGLPVVFVHGGPGAGFEPYHRQFFDPARYRIVLYDQRGAGRSTPHASLERNTTPDLVADLERIREFLGIERWVLFGGSWGSTLALVYAETHPERAIALILRGIFLCRPWEIRWFYQEGANHVFPDYWEEFVAPIPLEERHDLLHAHYRRLTSDDEAVRLASAKAWSVWEGRTATLKPNEAVVSFFSHPHTALSLARIEAHYFVHDSFLDPDQILRDADRIHGIPGVIVQGRYDIVCPFQSAYDLHRRWPQARLEIVPDAGHSAAEPGITQALRRATDEMAQRFG